MKMDLKLNILKFIIISEILICSESTIFVRINPEDLNSVIDFLENIVTVDIRNRQLREAIPYRRSNQLCSLLYRGFLNSMHLTGVMISLIGANILSTILIENVKIGKYDPHFVNNVGLPILHRTKSLISNTAPTQKLNNITRFSESISETCNIDHGCNNHTCWKTCHGYSNGTRSWCFTSPNTTLKQLQKCNTTDDCSKCWDCVEDCRI